MNELSTVPGRTDEVHYFVTVVIPVFNDAKRLERCLKALDVQSYPRAQFEIIVVDNGSTDGVENALSALNVRLEAETSPGSYQYAARNKGIMLAKGEILAFTDSDCIPESNWIEMGVKSLAGDENRVVAGKVSLFAKDSSRPSAVELYDMVTGFDQQDWVENWQFGAAGNLFAFKSAFDRVGLFDHRSKAGGDVEWGQRASASGLNLVYAEDVVVNHPARRKLSQLFGKAARTIGGVQDMSRRRPGSFASPLERGIVGDLMPPLSYCCRLVQDKRLPTIAAKARIVPVAFFVRYVEAYERLRLKWGGELRRR